MRYLLIVFFLLTLPIHAQPDPLERAARVLAAALESSLESERLTGWSVEATTFANPLLACPLNGLVYEPNYAGATVPGWIVTLNYGDILYDIRLAAGYGFLCQDTVIAPPLPLPRRPRRAVNERPPDP